MKRNYVRTIIREIKQSFGRFVAIIAIVALGVGFLVGILSSTPDMKASVDQYYKACSMSDYDIKSTMGLTDEDVSALSRLPQIDKVMPAYVTDVLMRTGESELLTGRLYGLDLSQSSTDSFINRLTLLSGHMPENPGECVIEKPNDHMSQLSIGDTLTLSQDEEDLTDTYKQQTFTIAGIVDSPYYFCNSKEPASVGNGRAGVILYADKAAYALDAYTDIFLTLNNQGTSFSDAYKTRIENTADELEKLSKDRIAARYEEVVSDAEKKLDQAKETLEKEKQKSEKKLADAARQIQEGQKDIDRGSAELEKAKAQIKTGRTQVKTAKADVQTGEAQLEKAKAQLDSGKQ